MENLNLKSEIEKNINISVVSAVYNEEDNLKQFIERLIITLNKITNDYEIIFVLDPSEDNSENIIIDELKKNPKIKLIKLSRRFGQPAATICGIQHSKGECCLTIDADLQDPPELVEKLYSKYKKENLDVVFTRRIIREGESFIKKLISKIGYKAIKRLSDIDIPEDVGDFRLISKKIVDKLKSIEEPQVYLRGMIAYIGFKQGLVDYERQRRFAGQGKYNKFFGSIKIGLDGLLGFSSKPIYIMSSIGFILAMLSFLLGIWYFIQKIIGIELTPGLPTNVLLITFFAGIQLLALGLIGEYVGRIYDQVKKRPVYIIDKKINFDD